MRLERGDVAVVTIEAEGEVAIYGPHASKGGPIPGHVGLTLDEARWLLTCALPAAIVELTPAHEGPPVPVGDQIPLGV
jgi:hypothetical protein